MTVTPMDAYWDELGIAWRAVNPDVDVIAQRLSVRLRFQAACARTLIVCGMPLSIALLALGAFTIWRGFGIGAWNFVTRGVALIMIAALLALISWSQRIGARGHIGTLAQMVDLALMRAQKFRRAALIGIYIFAVAAFLGTVGYFIRRHTGWRPPSLSPLEPLVLLAFASMTLSLYVRHASDDLKKLRYLKKALLPEPRGGAAG